MKKIIIPPVLVVLSLLANTIFVNAQRLPCGPYRIDTAALNKISQNRSSHNRPAALNALVRVYFHIVTNDDGTNAPVTTAQLASEFTSLLASYAADNICFLNAGIDTVKNTFLNTLFNADNDPNGTFFSPYQVPGCVNAFYTQVIKGNNAACNPPCGYGGIALGGIPGTFFLIANSNIGDGSSVGHEMGHSLGLLHTFETAFGFEKIDGSNSATAGDRIGDTPADPFAYNGQPCYAVSANGCTYTGTCTDPNGAKNFSPPYTNLMAYWQSNVCYPTLAATNGQFSVVESTIKTTRAIIDCSSPDYVTQFGITVSSGYYMSSAVNTFTTNGGVLFNGSAKATIGGGKVFLENGFRAQPSTNGVIRIVAKPCN
ncbi:MAG: hypothetical protein ABIN67_00535 [Ferruginibacter sp.]